MIARISTIDDLITFELLFNPLSPKSQIKQFQHLTNICSTKVEWTLGKCRNHPKRPFNIFKNKGKIGSMLNESLNQFKLDSTPFQQAFNNFCFQQCWMTCSNAPNIWFNKVLNAS